MNRNNERSNIKSCLGSRNSKLEKQPHGTLIITVDNDDVLALTDISMQMFLYCLEWSSFL